MLARVVIVGRPNVGKSTLFNRLIGKKKSIVHEISGTTRDRNDYEVLWKDKKFIITDTAGWSIDSSLFSENVFRQLDNAIAISDVVLFVVDSKEGIHSLDFQIAHKIRLNKKKIILVVNKIDIQKEEINGYEFYELGFDDIIFVSANHGRCIHDLMDKILVNIKYDRKEEKASEILKIIIVGKPNVGKSSFVNAVANEERSIVHDAPGTTRDSLTVHVQVENKEYILVDTAGLHRGSKVKDDMEYLSSLSTNYAVDDADVAVLVADASQGVGDTEVKIARLLIEKRKPVIISINKWDLIEKKEEVAKCFIEWLRQKMKFMCWADIVFISAKTKQRINKIFQEADIVFEQFSKRVAENELDEVIRDVVMRKPYVSKGKTLKFKEYLQVASKPPTFVFSVNDITLVHFSYKRFIENCLRDRFKFHGSPIILKFRKYYRKKL
ncbi:MAG: ribosome biogenesis GTPase Der [Endomicrobium sp.]|jgi:GTP-binding protein|nr:ribosome biogenesis GTPase Der [Endomicrobium sp.]